MAAPQIMPVEAAMSVIGIKPFLSREVEHIGKGKLEQIQAVPKKVHDLARQLVNGEIEAKFRTNLNYKALLKDMATGFDVDQVKEMVAKFPPELNTLGSALVIMAMHLVEQLDSLYPRSAYLTMAGPKQLMPSDTKLWRFVSILEVLDDPLQVFALMAQGALLKSQAEAVRLVYPTLSDSIDYAIITETIKAKAHKKSFQLNPRTEYGVRSWTGQGPVDTGLLRSAQDNIAQGKEKQTQNDQAVAMKRGQVDKTQTQKVESGP